MRFKPPHGGNTYQIGSVVRVVQGFKPPCGGNTLRLRHPRPKYRQNQTPLAGVIPATGMNPLTVAGDSNPLAGVIPMFGLSSEMYWQDSNPLAGVILRAKQRQH